MVTVDNVPKGKCCGCMACFNICPVNAINIEKFEGFFYPIINKSKCISCSECIAVCQCTGGKKRTYDKFPKEAFLYASKDHTIMSETTSGGFFTQLATDVINEHGIVFSPAFDKNWHLKFVGIDSVDMIKKIRGSKYVEADIGTIFQEVEEKLNQNKKVLFSGTPCQVNSLKSYLKFKNSTGCNNLILVAVVCHGNVSSDYFKRFIDFVSNGKKIKSINFREKTYGYSTSTFTMKFADGAPYRETYDNGYYMPAFFSGYAIRENCFNCKFRGGSTDADFIIGDYWKPTKDNLGQTVILAYSEYAKAYINKLKKSTSALMKRISVSEAILWNGNGDKNQSLLLTSPSENRRRKAFIEDAFILDLDEIRKKYFPVTMKKYVKVILRPIRYKIKRKFEKR